MIAFDDLHPDDRAARIELRGMLVDRRHELGYTQRNLAQQVGVAKSAVAQVETGTSWHVGVLQRIARPLRVRILLYPDGVPGGPYDTAATDPFRPSDPARADQWDRTNLIANLVAARRARSLTQWQAAEVLGCSESAVGAYERTRADLLVISAQRYCRAIGGVLAIELEEYDEQMAVAA